MDVGPVVAAGATVLVALTPVLREWSSARGTRARIKQDIELLNLLPKESSARNALEEHLERTLKRLIAQEHEMRRDPFGVALAVFFAGVTAFLGMRALDGSDVWWVPTAVMALFTIAGFAVSVPKVRRTPTGRVIKDEVGGNGLHG